MHRTSTFYSNKFAAVEWWCSLAKSSYIMAAGRWSNELKAVGTRSLLLLLSLPISARISRIIIALLCTTGSMTMMVGMRLINLQLKTLVQVTKSACNDTQDTI